MYLVLVSLTGITGTVFTICFIVWLVALLTNKKEVISRAGMASVWSLIIGVLFAVLAYGAWQEEIKPKLEEQALQESLDKETSKVESVSEKVSEDIENMQ